MWLLDAIHETLASPRFSTIPGPAQPLDASGRMSYKLQSVPTARPNVANAMHEGTLWYLCRCDEAPTGPFSTQDLIREIRDRRVPIDSDVCEVGAEEWTPILCVPEFAAVVRDVAPRPGATSIPPPTEVPARISQQAMWYVMDDGYPNALGPFSTETIVQRILSGRLPLTVKVNRQDGTEWAGLREIPLFALAVRVVRARERGGNS